MSTELLKLQVYKVIPTQKISPQTGKQEGGIESNLEYWEPTDFFIQSMNFFHFWQRYGSY